MEGRERRRLRCRGFVQGVGFRPTVHRLASAMGLDGFVLNGPDGVVIEIEGPSSAVRTFAGRLRASLPPLARLDGMVEETLPAEGRTGFEVRASEGGPRRRALVPPDAALCADCRGEMETPHDRRHRYPFITCTNCGPRFSIVGRLPYDRATTAMACFPLCDRCRLEYEDTADRRFHAEPVCCPACGPRLWLAGADGATLAEGPEAAPAEARALLASGLVVAVKGLGGFQLACRADDESAVTRLRQRKRRPGKPLAVMAADMDAARRAAAFTDADAALMGSPRCPIVLAARREPSPLAPSVAPGLDEVGVMLPTAPLHVELFRGAPYAYLVMTSGNLSDEPIACGNREALDRLSGVADAFLLHDRDVVRRVDDSVVRSTASGPAVVRRSRGYVPEPLPLPRPAGRPVLALGGHLQVTACVASGDQAFLSQHVGDLDTDGARAFLAEVTAGLEDFLEVRPGLVAVDLHPDYASTWLGESLASARGGTVLRIQHHAAHAAAVLAEAGRFPAAGEVALAVVLDGTGFGPDGTAWGGEWLALAGDGRWERLAHLETVPLVGGEAAVREPWRVAAAALAMGGCAHLLERSPLAALVAGSEMEGVARLAASESWPRASGAGRLFEAAGALFGLCARNGYEGEAAARFEALAAPAWPVEAWEGLGLLEGGALPLLPFARLLATATERLAGGESPAAAAAGFHATFCRLAADLTVRTAGGISGPVALGGGCLVNRLLRDGLTRALRDAGLEPLLPSTVPPGDGGLAYGQAVLASLGEG